MNMESENPNNNSSTDFDVLHDGNNLYEAFRKCKKGSIWKESVQRYEMNLLKNLNTAQKEIKTDTYKQLPFNEFTLCERGRLREIKAIHINDRVVLRSLCDNILTPYFTKYLIYDNGASLKDKGVEFSRNRLVTHLHKYYRQHGNNEGYILLIDFTKFFDNVHHKKLMEEYSKRMKDDKVLNFMEKIIDTFKIDVSYMSDEEYKSCMDEVFNALDYAKIDKRLLTGEKFMGKSIGIGSQISQVSGLLYPTRIDNYCKIVKGLKYYGRYMDDTYIIHESKEYLQQLLSEIQAICKEYGIFINQKKTQIVKLSKTFTFLKVRYTFTDTGKVIKRMNKKSITRERRKLKKFRKFLDEGKMPYKDIENAYNSWRGSLKHYSAHHTLRNMDNLYNKLFIKPFIEGRDYYEYLSRKRTKNQGFTGDA